MKIKYKLIIINKKNFNKVYAKKQLLLQAGHSSMILFSSLYIKKQTIEKRHLIVTKRYTSSKYIGVFISKKKEKEIQNARSYLRSIPLYIIIIMVEAEDTYLWFR